MTTKKIPVIDLFAGPGGLGEGFSSLEDDKGNRKFKISLSIEMDPQAHKTLELRAFFKQFERKNVPEEYYEHIRNPQRMTRERLFDAYPKESHAAKNEAWRAILGKEPRKDVNNRIRAALGNARRRFVLIGGPPCQAYSLAGRSRNKGISNYVPEKDHRQYLYLQYLQIIADHNPSIFVMENVKGLLSARVASQRMFDRIRDDLQNPAVSLRRENMPVEGDPERYDIYALNPKNFHGFELVDDFVVRCEDYGVPQARHRVILLGIRTDIGKRPQPLQPPEHKVTLRQILQGMPPLRSGLSKANDSLESWRAAILSAATKPWFKALKATNPQVYQAMKRNLHHIALTTLDRGDEFVKRKSKVEYNAGWYLDHRIGGICNHATRGHMEGDLLRYFFAACFAEKMKKSPELADFPVELLPDHRNVKESLKGALFADRFRVQVWDRCSSTVVSHISKDGHYYIHPDPVQCRSLTVREAARIQTFPDNYFFCGNRTEQYHQVGNAVPPLLARQIAEIVSKLL